MTTMQNDLDAVRARTLARLRTLATAGANRRRDETSKRLKMRNDAVISTNEPAERIASLAQAAALAEAREEGYRAAVADLLGALEVGL